MSIKFSKISFEISMNKLAFVIFLVSGTLGWFFLLNIQAIEIFSSFVPNNPFWLSFGQILFYGFAIFWGGVGVSIGGRVDRRKLLLTWIALGVVTTALLPFFHGPVFSIIFSSLLGLSLGLGLPCSTAFIAECTVAEERARVSGIILFLSFILAAIAAFVASSIGSGIISLLLIGALLRSTSFFAFIFNECESGKERIVMRHNQTIYKNFAYYLIPWVLINIASTIAINLIPNHPDYSWAIDTGSKLRLGIIAISALLVGSVADRFGRKPPLLIGLTMLVISSFIISFAMSPTTAFIFLAISGFSWGSFFAIFLSVPGDLAIFSLREKFYFLSTGLPIAILFFTSPFLGGPGSGSISSLPASVPQILGFILFISLIPLFFAKESLPESKMKARRLKDYLKKVRQVIGETKKE